MFVHVSDLTVGQGDTDDLLSRIRSDLVPIYSAAKGFIGYYAMKTDSEAVTTIQVFDDLASLQAAVEDAKDATSQIVNDFEVTNTEHVRGDVGVASAFGAIHVP